MQIDITLSEEQVKALLTEHINIEDYVQNILENRANRIIDSIVLGCANGDVATASLTVEEQADIDKLLNSRIITNVSSLPRDIKRLLVKKAVVPTAIERLVIEEESLR